jgi:hypothetical protein
MAAASLYGIVFFAGVADNDLVSVKLHSFHSTGSNFIGTYRPDKPFTHCSPPLGAVAVVYPDQEHLYARIARTNSV